MELARQGGGKLSRRGASAHHPLRGEQDQQGEQAGPERRGAGSQLAREAVETDSGE